MGHIYNWFFLLTSVFLIIMGIVWLILINTPSKLQNLTWLYGYTVLIIGGIGALWVLIGKMSIHKSRQVKTMKDYMNKW